MKSVTGIGNDITIGVGETDSSVGGILLKPATSLKSDKNTNGLQCQVNSFSCKYTDVEAVLHFYRSEVSILPIVSE